MLSLLLLLLVLLLLLLLLLLQEALSLYCSFEVPSREELAVFASVAAHEEQRRQWLRLTTDMQVRV